MKNVLLIGVGSFGLHIAQKLYPLDHEILAVDINEQRINAALSTVTSAQIGDSTDSQFLENLGVENFDICIVTIGEDFQSSLETTNLLKELGAKLVISRAMSDVHAKFLLRNGADDVIYPEKQIASWMAIRYTSDNILDYVELDEDNGVFEVFPPESWIGKSLIEIDVRKRYNINVMGFRKNGKLDLNISPQSVFNAEQSIMVLGSFKNVHKCFKI